MLSAIYDNKTLMQTSVTIERSTPAAGRRFGPSTNIALAACLGETLYPYWSCTLPPCSLLTAPFLHFVQSVVPQRIVFLHQVIGDVQEPLYARAGRRHGGNKSLCFLMFSAGGRCSRKRRWRRRQPTRGFSVRCVDGRQRRRPATVRAADISATRGGTGRRVEAQPSRTWQRRRRRRKAEVAVEALLLVTGVVLLSCDRFDADAMPCAALSAAAGMGRVDLCSLPGHTRWRCCRVFVVRVDVVAVAAGRREKRLGRVRTGGMLPRSRRQHSAATYRHLHHHCSTCATVAASKLSHAPRMYPSRGPLAARCD